MSSLLVAQARVFLAEVLREKAQDAARTNTRISRDEQRMAHPFLKPSIAHVRAGVGAGKSPEVEPVAAHALVRANVIWDGFVGTGRSAKYLSAAELDAMAQAAPELDDLNRIAAARARAARVDPRAAVRAFFAAYDFSDDANGHNAIKTGLPNGAIIDVRPQFFPQNRVGIPANVLASFDYYWRGQDWSGTQLQRATLNGADVYLVHTSTDGDDRYLEVFSPAGEPLLSARLNATVLLGWDDTFGRARFFPNMTSLDNPTTEVGLADPAASAAAGQLPRTWIAPLTLTRGELHYDGPSNRLTTLDLPQLTGSPFREVAEAALEWLWANQLSDRVRGTGKPFLLGDTAEGVLKLGTFTRADGKTYQVADYVDTGAKSSTLYFDRTTDGRLRLATVQNNA